MNIPHTDTTAGLSGKEASARLARYGYNELPAEKKRSIAYLALEVMKEPMFILLLATASLYLILGDIRDSLSLFGAVLMIIGITLYQKRKTENALRALRDLSSPQALVVRDGRMMRIPGRELVPGDIIHVKEGDRIPADALILKNLNLTVDESILTGESVPVTKTEWDGNELAATNIPGGDKLPSVYSGTLAVGGSAQAMVYETGQSTQLGGIGKSLLHITREETLLNKEIRRIVRMFTVLGVGTCIALVLLYGFYYDQWLKGILAGLTLSISLIPEEFPVVLTLFLTLGAWRIARLKVLTRRPDVIETLGAATVLCSDKTGTITLNQMRVQRLYASGGYANAESPIPDEFNEVIRYGLLASRQQPFDPMDKAIHMLASGRGIHQDEWKLAREYPLSPGQMSIAQVWQTGSDTIHAVAAKGAPEAIFKLCRLPAQEALALEQEVYAMAEQGLRVLGVAKATFTGTRFPEDQPGFDFRFCGLLGFADPVRPQVSASLRECYSAGMRVIMITGDYPATAKSIGRQIGMKNPDSLLTGDQIDKLDDTQLAEKVKEVNIFSRVVPHQKLRLVYALKAQGEIVAMTGDGVNDAPALKAAHIGIAMGQKGTDVAREASDIVLLNDDFNSIVAATRMGRRIFDNLQKAISYIIAIHVPIAGLALIPVFGESFPVVLFPIHIAFFELLTDPVLSIAFEAEKDEKNSMQRPPRRLHEPLVSRRRLFLSLLQGLFVLGAVIGMYFYSLSAGRGMDSVRTITFATMIAGNLGLVLTNRSWTRGILSRDNQRNKTLVYLLLSGAVIILVVFYVPPVRSIFHFSELSFRDLALSSVAGFASVAWFEVVKLFDKKGKIIRAK